MRGRVVGRAWQFASEAVDGVHLVGVVILDDAHDWLDGGSVFVNESVGVKVMQGLRVLRRTVWESVIDGDVNTYFTTSEDVVEERNSWLYCEVLDNDFTVWAI